MALIRPFVQKPSLLACGGERFVRCYKWGFGMAFLKTRLEPSNRCGTPLMHRNFWMPPREIMHIQLYLGAKHITLFDILPIVGCGVANKMLWRLACCHILVNWLVQKYQQWSLDKTSILDLGHNRSRPYCKSNTCWLKDDARPGRGAHDPVWIEEHWLPRLGGCHGNLQLRMQKMQQPATTVLFINPGIGNFSQPLPQSPPADTYIVQGQTLEEVPYHLKTSPTISGFCYQFYFVQPRVTKKKHLEPVSNPPTKQFVLRSSVSVLLTTLVVASSSFIVWMSHQPQTNW